MLALCSSRQELPTDQPLRALQGETKNLGQNHHSPSALKAALSTEELANRQVLPTQDASCMRRQMDQIFKKSFVHGICPRVLFDLETPR